MAIGLANRDKWEKKQKRMGNLFKFNHQLIFDIFYYCIYFYTTIQIRIS